MKNIQQYIGYLMIRGVITIIGIIPFRVLYWKANFLRVVLHRVFGYRKKVVQKNLRSSFPEKSESELKKIERLFYKNLADILLESIKVFTMKQKDLSQRYHLINPEITTEHYRQGKDIVIVAAHYTNWEWGHGIFSEAFKFQGVVLYKPLKNKYVDRYVKKHRSAFNSDLVSIKKTREYFLSKPNQNSAIVLGADQSPSNRKKSYIADFLNHKTYFLHGPEKYPRFLNAPVYYMHIRRIKRGFYETELELICDDPHQIPDGAIIEKYAELMEKDIREKPENWLWSHKRWKHKVPEASEK
jgi:KDO2-lipid IV(A) lauroyltransferase